MRILALDMGTKTGWALWDEHRIESGVQVFDVKRGESPGMRYIRFNRWLQSPIVFQLGLVVFEQAHHRGGAATEVAAGFSTRILELCARERIEHASVHSATLKRFATGHGNAKKHEMYAAAISKWPTLAFEDDNEIDACWLLEYAMREIAPQEAPYADAVR